MALQQGKPPRHRPLLHAGSKEIVVVRETGQQFGEFGPPLVWLRPYKPAMVGKLLDIFRVFYNFVEVGRDKQTPAMRLGLARER